MADQSITDAGGSTVTGRLLARIATVTLNNTTVTVPVCTTAPTLRVIKHVINDNGGTAAASAWTLTLASLNGGTGTGSAAGAESPGTIYTLEAGKAYAVTEDVGPSGYNSSLSSDCVIANAVAATSYTCTVTNNDIAVPPAVSTSGTTSGGGSSVPIPPLIDVVKVPSPLSLPGGPGPVTYTYTVRNPGIVPLSNVTIVDDSCSPLILVSGDTNANQKLDVSETWTYDCFVTLSQTHTNTVVATGWYNGISAADIASATVVVGVPLIPPLIHVTKVPNHLSVPVGGAVTYTEKITNPGTVPLLDVHLTDDKCAPVTYISGDTNRDSRLDTNETWTYTCKTTLLQNTTNTATATGTANGIAVKDLARSTVLVYVPGLPKTGYPPSFHLKIPVIKVDAPIDPVGLAPDGSIGVPKGPADTAWFDQSPRPGEAGSAVVDGHSGWKDGVQAVFDNLSGLKKGDKIYVEDGKGVTSTFVVRELRTYANDEMAPSVFSAKDGGAHLNLITCSGTWNAAEKTHSDRLVVFSDKE